MTAAANHYGEGPPSYREAEVDPNYLKNEPPANYMNEPPSGYPPRLGNPEDEEGRYYPGENRNRPDYYNLEAPKPLDGESDGRATPSVDGRNCKFLCVFCLFVFFFACPSPHLPCQWRLEYTNCTPLQIDKIPPQ